MQTNPMQAMVRFGLGRRGAEALPADPLAWLREQLNGPDPAMASPISSTLAGLEAHQQLRMMKLAEGQPTPVQALWKADAAVAAGILAETECPFRERLVWLWANHFTVSVRRGEVRPLVLPFVQDAIR